MLPTPAEPAQFGANGMGGTCSTTAGGSGPATDTGTTLAEASATLAALHPQVQRNLAEIEYDWWVCVSPECDRIPREILRDPNRNTTFSIIRE